MDAAHPPHEVGVHNQRLLHELLVPSHDLLVPSHELLVPSQRSVAGQTVGVDQCRDEMRCTDEELEDDRSGECIRLNVVDECL